MTPGMSRWYVRCARCGTVGLSDNEYRCQLVHTDEFWRCPRCGDVADFEGSNGPDDVDAFRAAAVDLCDAVAMFVEAHDSMARPDPPDPVDWARGVVDAMQVMSDARRRVLDLVGGPPDVPPT